MKKNKKVLLDALKCKCQGVLLYSDASGNSAKEVQHMGGVNNSVSPIEIL